MQTICLCSAPGGQTGLWKWKTNHPGGEPVPFGSRSSPQVEPNCAIVSHC